MERVDLLIKGGTVVLRERARSANVAINQGKLAAILEPNLVPDAAKVIDATGKYVMPGVVDPEGHPGHSFPLDLDFQTESPAAAAGGVTTWGIQDPSPRMGTKPFKHEVEPSDVVSFHDVMDIGIKTGQENCITDFFYTAQLETDQQSEEIVEYAEKYGLTSYKFYCHAKHPEITAKLWYVYRTGLAAGFDDGVVFKTMENVAKITPPGIVSIHPENFEIVRVFSQRLMEAGRKDMEAWTDRSPDFVEAHHVRQYAYLAKVTKCPLYIQHTTTAETLLAIRKAKEEGTEVYAQSSPVYLCLPRGTWKINVPLRDPQTMEVLWEAVRKGEIDALGSDHVVAYGSRAEMEVPGDVWKTVSGFPSRVEMMLPLMLHEGVNKGRITFERLVEVMCEAPARIFGIYPRKGSLQVGSDGDVVIVDLKRRVTVKNEMIHSRPKWTILEGREMTGWPVMTIRRGEVLMEWPDGEPKSKIVAKTKGQYLARRPGSRFLM
jgi:dihydropyrimidinase/dihydroorotase